jgi:hypothetical protein
MTALLHPGVFVQEVPGGVRSIEGVATSTTIFVGETERGPLEPTKILNAGDYARQFGAQLRHRTPSGTTDTVVAVRVAMRYEVDLFFQNGGSVAYIQRANGTGTANVIATAVRSTLLLATSPGEWGNHIFVVITNSAADIPPTTSPDTPGDRRFRVTVYYQPPGGTAGLVEDFDRLTTLKSDENFVVDVLKRSFYVRWAVDASGVAIEPPARNAVDTLPANTKVTELTQAQLQAITGAQFTSAATNVDAPASDADLATILHKLDGIDDAAILIGATEKWVDGTTFAQANVQTYYNTFQSYTDGRPKQDLFYLGDLPSFAGSATTTAAVASAASAARAFNHSTFIGMYWPHIVVADPVGPTLTSTITIPSSGAVAGAFARTDARRGVWKAPAGVEATIGGGTRMLFDIIDAQQDDLNPIGVNVIRLIPGAGTVVWGSRTTRPDSEWRYVPVRRTAMFLRKSIFNGIQFAVFEPNDTALWATLRATIGAFMETQFRNGAFAGTTTKEAFFVKVDSETTTPDDQAAGIVNILVGFAPLRPAEFVVVKLSQKTATAA